MPAHGDELQPSSSRAHRTEDSTPGKLRAAVLDDYQNAASCMADWSSLDHRVKTDFLTGHTDDEDNLARDLSDYHILVVMRERTRISASLIERLPRLQLIVTSGMRNKAIDLAAAAARGVTVCGTASLTHPPFELTWALILGLVRHIAPENAALRSGGPWQHTVGFDLAGKTLGILGLGRIGSRVARVGAAFDMDVVAWSQNLTAERADAGGARLAASKEELLEQSDVLSIHVVLSERTRNLIGPPELARLRPSAYLVNTARAGIVDQEALIAALRDGKIAGAGLDVFDIEPLPSHHPFRTLPNVLATPHLGYVSVANYQVYFAEAVEDIAAFLAGTPVRVITTSDKARIGG